MLYTTTSATLGMCDISMSKSSAVLQYRCTRIIPNLPKTNTGNYNTFPCRPSKYITFFSILLAYAPSSDGPMQVFFGAGEGAKIPLEISGGFFSVIHFH